MLAGLGQTVFVDPHGVTLPAAMSEGFQDVMAALDYNDMSDYDGSMGECYEKRSVKLE